LIRTQHARSQTKDPARAENFSACRVFLFCIQASAENPQLAEPLFIDRFESFKALGYDPLTTPVEW
jgi:hypothetical protein